MFKFVVQQNSPALMRMRTLVAKHTTNYAAALGTAAAFARVKSNYPKVFRDRPYGESEKDTWETFKTKFGGDVRTGFLTGTTYKSIRYRVMGKGRGEVYLWGRWPNFEIQEYFVDVNGTRVHSAKDPAEFRRQLYRYFGPKLALPDAFGRAGYEEAVRGESDRIIRDAYKGSIKEAIQDEALVTAQFNRTRKFRGKEIITGTLAGKAGRASFNDFMWIDNRGLRYRHEGKNYWIPGESYRTKRFGTRRSGMFQGAKLDPYADEWERPSLKAETPKHSAKDVDVLRLRSRAVGGEMSDRNRVFTQIEAFYWKVLNAEDGYKVGKVNPMITRKYFKLKR